MYRLKEPAPGRAENLSEISSRVREILADIERRGEAAVREYSRRFDGWDPDDFRVPD